MRKMCCCHNKGFDHAWDIFSDPFVEIGFQPDQVRRGHVAVPVRRQRARLRGSR